MGVWTKGKDLVQRPEVGDAVNADVVAELFEVATVVFVDSKVLGGPALGGGEPG